MKTRMLTKKQYMIAITKLEEGKLSNKQISKLVPCHEATISVINNGLSQKGEFLYGGEYPIRKVKIEPYTDESVLAAYLACDDREQVALDFRISQSTIGRIMRRKGYHSKDKKWIKK